MKQEDWESKLQDEFGIQVDKVSWAKDERLREFFREEQERDAEKRLSAATDKGLY